MADSSHNTNFQIRSKSEVSNYKPISLLCTISKCLEISCTIKFIIDFITNSISTGQFVFLPMHSTLQHLLNMFDSIYTSIEIKVQTDVIYLDFKKAFDSVPHNELLVKLWKVGITGGCGNGSGHTWTLENSAFVTILNILDYCLCCQVFPRGVYWVVYSFLYT